MSDEYYTARQAHYLAKLTELTFLGDLDNLSDGHDVDGPWFSESRSGCFNNSLVLLFLCYLTIKVILITYWMGLTCQRGRDWPPKDEKRLVLKKV